MLRMLHVPFFEFARIGRLASRSSSTQQTLVLALYGGRRGTCFPLSVTGMAQRRLPRTADNRSPATSPTQTPLGCGVWDPPQREHGSTPSTATFVEDRPQETTAAAALEGLEGAGANIDVSVSYPPPPGSRSPQITRSAAGAASARFRSCPKDNSVGQEADGDALGEEAAGRGGTEGASRSAKSRGDQQKLPAFNFSFAMGGWLMFYSFGVAKCLLDHGLHKVSEKQSAIGSSAGSLAAAALVLEADIDKIVEQAKASFIPRAHAAKFRGFVYGMFFIGKFLRESMLACLPFERVPSKTSPPGRLVVVMASVLGWNSVRAKDFDDGEDLMNALQCSCACFPLVMPHVYRGKRCFDGFFSEGASAPSLDEDEAEGLETVTISPLYASSASIRPSRYVPLSWIALPPNDTGAIDWLYDLGYRDALFWMAKEGIEHTCSHASRLSRSCGMAGPSAAAVAEGGRRALESEDSSSCDDIGDDDSDDEDEEDGGATEVVDDHRDTQKAAAGVGAGVGAGAGAGVGAGVVSPSSTSTLSPSSPSSSAPWAADAAKPLPAAPGPRLQERQFYVRQSFANSLCHMRPRRERHAELDEPTFVPTLEKFVGHGSYHAAADFLFVVLFNFVWRPAAALLLCTDLLSRLVFACSRAFWGDLRPTLCWLIPTLLLGGAALDHRPSGAQGLTAAVAVIAVVEAVASREGARGKERWREAGQCARALLDFRRVLLSTLVPWARGRFGKGVGAGSGGAEAAGGRMRSEALERSFVYRAVSFFM